MTTATTTSAYQLKPLTAAISMLLALPVQAESVNWIGSSDYWDIASNWDPSIPSNTSDVRINVPGQQNTTVRSSYVINSLNITGDERLTLESGDLALNSASSIGAYNQVGGSLHGTGTVTINGPATWTGGAMYDTGVSTFNGGLNISGSGYRQLLGGRTLNTNATVWSTAGDYQGEVYVYDNSTLNNTGNWQDENQFNNRLGVYGTATFNNSGTYNKTGAGVTEIGMVFNNSGTVNADAGILNFTSGGVSSGTILGNGTLVFSGGVSEITGVYNVSGATRVDWGTANFTGTVANSGGNLGINGGRAVFNNTAGVEVNNLNLSGGNLEGTQNLTVLGNADWTGGFMTDTGVTTINGSLNINGGNYKQLDGGRTLNTNHTIWSTAGNYQGEIYAANGSTINNTGIWQDENQFTNRIGVYGNAIFNNTGSYTKTGAGSTDISMAFNNTSTGADSGVVNVQAGTLILSGGGTSSGSFTGAGTLQFSGVTHTLTPTSSLSNNQVVFNGGTTEVKGSYDVPGKTEVNGGAVNFTGTVANRGGSLDISAGAAVFDNSAGVAVSRLNLSGGTLGGAQGLTVLGNADWSGGYMSGTGVTTITGDLNISGGNYKQLNGGRTLNTNKTVWTTAGDYQGEIIAYESTINNNGSWQDQNQFINRMLVNGGGIFNNNGTYTKVGSGNTEISTVFNNSGVVNVQAGKLNISGGGTSSGSYTGAGSLEFGGGSHTLTPAASISNNQVLFSGGSADVAGNYNVAGKTQVSGGTVNFTGTVANSGGSLDISGGKAVFNNTAGVKVSNLKLTGGTLDGTQNLTVQGNADWSGGGMVGTGVTTINGGLSISGNNYKQLYDGRTLNTNATVWTTADDYQGEIYVYDSTINNNGSWQDQNPYHNRLWGYASGTFNNAGTYTKSGAGQTEINVAFNNKASGANTGVLNVDAGLLHLTQGVTGQGGSIAVRNAGALQLDANSSAATLAISSNYAAALALGANNLEVSTDYANSNFGSGNAFNPYANVTRSSGQILASGDVAQTVSGAAITGGTSANPTLTIGNVHVGDTHFDYQLANAGTTGPALRGALQTQVHGGNITDTRLSGAGVSAGNFGPLATGAQSEALAVTFKAANAGVLPALTGQTVALVNNFDNVADQVLHINLAPDAAAYEVAKSSILPSTLDFGAYRAGDSIANKTFRLSNTAETSAYSEQLLASYGPVAAPFTVNKAGTSDRIVAGDHVITSVGLGSSVAGDFTGANKGGMQVTLTSKAGAADLSDSDLGKPVLEFSGKVYAPAVAVVATPTLDFGIVHTGDVLPTRTISVQNAASAALTDSLNASINSSDAAVTAAGAVTGLAAGATNNTQLQVTLDTRNAGLVSANAQLNLSSHNPDMSDLSLATQTVPVTGQINNYAQAGYSLVNGAGLLSGDGRSFSLNFGSVLPGTNQLASLALLNCALGYADTLGGSFDMTGSGFGFSGFTPFANLTAGNAKQLAVTFDTFGLLAGNDYFADIIFHGTGSNSSGYAGSIGDYTLHLSGSVAPVPVPAMGWLLALSLSGMLLFSRRQAL